MTTLITLLALTALLAALVQYAHADRFTYHGRQRRAPLSDLLERWPVEPHGLERHHVA